jgi:APA family basic amino acid/polyamine antiporter
MEYGMSIAAVANGWSGYFNNALIAMGIGLPTSLTRPPSLGGVINLPASLIILMIMALLIVGIKESAKFNKVMVAVKVSAILIFIAFAMFNVNPENWSPFMPYGWFETLPSGKTVGVLAGASIVFFAYVGFDAVSTAAEEAINPQRDLPKGIINSLVFCTIIYIIVAALLTGVVPYQELNVSSPVAFALAKIGFPWASALVSIGVIAGLATVMLVLYYALTRIIFAMSRDGLLPSSLSSVNKNTQTPIKTILICGILISTIAGFTSLGTLAEIVNIGTLSAFVIVCLGVIFLRNNGPRDKNTFRNKWHPVVPVLGIISCSLLMIFLPIQTWVRFLIWILIGIGMYFVYSYRNSKLN